MKRKFLSLLLAVAMLLTAFPMATVTQAADAASTDVKLYDAHITGNVVIGGTLTANFKPALDDADIANLCPGLDVEKTKASIEWYSKSRYGSRSSGTKNLSNSGSLTYTVPSTYTTQNNPAIFFKITPKNADGEAIGDTVYSTISYMPQSINGDATVPVAYNAHISPLNGDGVIKVGETVAARYAFIYRKSASIGEMNSRYTWYTSDELLISADDIESKATKVQDESTTATYTIKPADSGKYLYAKVVAVAADGAEAESAVYTKNHLGNAFLPNANSLTGHSVSTGTNSHGGFNDQSGYPAIKLLADGCAPISNSHNPSTFVQANNNTINTERTLLIDAGDVVSFDGIYLAHGFATIGKLIISYSNDNTNWTDLVVNSSCTLTSPGENEFLFNEVLSAKYFKLLAMNSNTGTLNIDEFYPFLKNTTKVEFTKPAFAQLNGSDIEVQAWGTPLSEVKKAENGFVVKSDLDAEGTTTNGDAIAQNVSFVTKEVTSDGDVYTAIANPENVIVTEELENTYLKVDDGKKASYYEVVYAGNIAETEEGVITSAATTTGTGIQLMGGAVDLKHHDEDGNAVGKYLLKTQLKLPSKANTQSGAGVRTIIHAKQGTGANISNILILNGYLNSSTSIVNGFAFGSQMIGIPAHQKQTDYGFKIEKWLDVEMLFDYDSTPKGELEDGEASTINVTTWIDGILVAKETYNWINPQTVTGGDVSSLTPYLQLYPNKAGDIVYRRNSSFRQVWDADTHVVENDYELKIVNAADESEAKAVTAGSYTVSNNMNIYKGDSYVDYIAKYYVNDGSRELVDLAVVKDAEDVVTVTEDELAENSVEIKAFSFCDKLTPNYVSVAVTE